ncbi:MAG: hypothetical protein HYX60_07185, partial [Legionella longbeachae]|nr:hypothetical protein [Legionella longbeachae]
MKSSKIKHKNKTLYIENKNQMMANEIFSSEITAPSSLDYLHSLGDLSKNIKSSEITKAAKEFVSQAMKYEFEILKETKIDDIVKTIIGMDIQIDNIVELMNTKDVTIDKITQQIINEDKIPCKKDNANLSKLEKLSWNLKQELLVSLKNIDGYQLIVKKYDDYRFIFLEGENDNILTENAITNIFLEENVVNDNNSYKKYVRYHFFNKKGTKVEGILEKFELCDEQYEKELKKTSTLEDTSGSKIWHDNKKNHKVITRNLLDILDKKNEIVLKDPNPIKKDKKRKKLIKTITNIYRFYMEVISEAILKKDYNLPLHIVGSLGSFIYASNEIEANVMNFLKVNQKTDFIKEIQNFSNNNFKYG